MKKIALLITAAFLCSCSSVTDIEESGKSASSYRASSSYQKSARFGQNSPSDRLTAKPDSLFETIFKPFRNDDISDHNMFIYR